MIAISTRSRSPAWCSSRNTHRQENITVPNGCF